MYDGGGFIKDDARVQNYLNSEDFETDSSYWKSHLSDSYEFIKFYNVKSINNDFKKINLDNEKISAFLKNHNASLFQFIAAAFSLYLSRIDDTKGCILKTNIERDLDNLNTLLKVEYIENIPFKQHLSNIEKVYDDAFEHTKLDIENYVSDISSFYSIHDSTDSLENNDEGSVLALNIYKNHLELSYNASVFTDVYIEHMLANINSLINYVLEFPDEKCRDVPILSNEEKALISEFSKGKQMDFDANKTLAMAFRENALENPNRLAVDDGVNQISYIELEKSSNSIAHDLKNNYGIGFGDFVGLMLPRDFHYLELALALNKIGAVFIPIDADYPNKRIAHMMEISKSEHIITTKELAQNINSKINVILREDLNSNNDVDLELVDGTELFALLFTSGTTGIPKGIMISNKQVASTAIAFGNIFDSSSEDYVAGCYASFSFIISFRLFWALYEGKSCRIFNESERKDILLLIRILKENPIHDIILPPALAVPILENDDLKLDYMVSVGSKLTKLPNKINNTKLINLYGSTEILSFANLCDLNKGDMSIGRPFSNTWAYILDKNNLQVPIGVPGEICISNDYLSLGYYDNPDLTSRIFIDNPYCDSEDNKRLYKTGDIGFYNFDGKIEIIGRNDDQLSVRGFRVESEEILGIVNRFGTVSDVCLDVDNDNLIMYYVACGDLDIDEVKNALKDQLPDYMIPSLFIELDEIPLNVNGKIDKSELRSISSKNLSLDIDDEVLKCIVDSFKEVLNTDFVLLDDDFISLGGNSLSAMELQLSLKEKLDVSLSSNELIELSTPNRIGDYIKFNSESRFACDEVNYTFDNFVPLSDSQLNVYLDERVGDMGTAYNNSFKIGFDDNCSADDIKNAIGKLLDVFPVLSAHVVEKDSEFFMAFDANPEITEESINDVNSFVRPFELDKSLSRFIIVEDGESNILCMDFHHLIFDGTSSNVLLDKLFAILEGADVDFVDNGALRQISFEESIASDSIDDARQFFDDMFADRDEANDLLPSVGGGYGFEYLDTFDIDGEYLNSFLQSHSITHNQFFASVFAYALSRFTGNPKVLFNLIENGRNHIDLSESVGMFVRTLPLLFDCTNQTIDSFMGYSRGLINSVMKYDFYPFNVLANEYNLNSNILFQYSHDIFKNLADFNVEELQHDLDCDLSVNIFDSNGSFGIKVQYSDVYSKEFIESLFGSFKLILNEIMFADYLSDINYVPDSDIELLDSYNKTECPLKYADVLDAFNDNLSRHPDNRLVSCRDISYSYGEGAFIADKIAESLRDMGVESQDNVAFLVERSELYMFCVLGIMSCGAVYVPLDDAHPDERIKYLIENTNSKVIIASDETYERADDLSDDAAVLNISDIIKGDIGCLSSLPVDYGKLACILYTSGTTGLPKGVKLTRKAILNFTEFYVNESDMTNKDVYGLFASIGFDVAIKGIFSSIYSGASLNVVPEDIKLDMDKLNKYFTDYGVTHTHITTQVAKLFINTSDRISLTELVTGGEKLGEIDYPADCRFIDTYGPTEACVYVTSIDEKDKIDSASVGHLLNNLKAYVLDDNLNRTPSSAVGELYLSGYQIAEGYLNREEETKNAFLNNPFEDNEDYGVMYRTGDLARFLPDGSIDIVGRRDNQVKIRGNRVELSEIESVLRELDYIDDVTVQIMKNNNDNEVVAYVVAEGEFGDEALHDLISKHVGQHKPDYMIPSFVVSLDEIPLTVNGKVDKRTLPEVNLDSLRAEYVAPTNDKEKLIVEAFEKVFNKEKISIHDDFVRLGGDSLTAIKLISHLKDFNISAGDILSLRTPKDLAESIKLDDFDLDIYSLDSGCPLNESQLNVYLDIIANDKVDSYLIPININISNEFTANEVCDALDEMFEVHPILRMHISDDYEVPYLVKGARPSVSVESGLDSEFLTKPFDLHKGLCRFLIVENSGQCELYVVFHHIIFDALSESVFREDLKSILDGKSVDVEDSFLKISAFNQQIQNTEEYGEAEMFYDSMLADVDDAGILLGSMESEGPGIEQADLDFDYNLFKSFLEENGISENVLFTGVFAYTLSRFIDGDEALFNIVENGRDRFNNFNSIGMYVNTLPFLVDCKNQEISSFISNVSDLLYSVMRYNFYPFKSLANKYDIDSSILFQFIPDWVGNSDDDGLFNDMIEGMDDLISDFAADVIKNGEGYRLRITYSDKYSNDLVQRFIESYRLILQDIISVTKLGEINYVSKSDLEILDRINETDSSLMYQDILDAFNDHLGRNPENSLVSYNGRVYTYAEGAFIANRIAEKLRDLGVKSQDPVSFLTERSEYYMFSVLGILSIGAVYVPLDDDYPDERLQLMVEDTNSSVVIVSDGTYGRAKDLAKGQIILNISDIVNDEIGSLNCLPAVHGNLACILYTSGTTGIPKGVKITRKAIANYANSYVEKSDMNSNDVFALYASIGFDVGSIKSICVPIYAGACLSVVPKDIRLNLMELNRHFIDNNVTHANLPTQIAKLFINEIESTSLSILVAGGEKLGEIDGPLDYKFIDAYGPTECCVSISAIEEVDKIDSSSVGHLLNNIRAYILDDEGRQVPVGAVGELYVSGSQVAEGYLNRDEETGKAFLPNPFDDEYNVMYRTGDLVRLLPDGSLGIVGRRDSQVKIRGNRVELSEVESIIREVVFVDDVTVQTIKNESNNELVAYVVVNEELDDVELKNNISSYVGECKPPYMIPSFVVRLDEIPLTVNGKVDKRALPEVDLDSLRVEYVAPTNEIEREIANAFELVFNQKEVGLFDDFLRLGGDSITAIRVISLLREKSISCKARDILNYKTPYLIAQHVNEGVETVSYDACEGVVDLHPIQEFFFDQINMNVYTQEFVLKAKIDLDIDILQEALNQLCNIHDMLRVVYKFDDDNKPIQEILPPNTRIYEINEYYLTDNLNNELLGIIRKSASSIDMTNHLFDVNLIHYKDVQYLTLVLHHLIVDGVSWNNLLVDLTYIYFRLLAGKEIKLIRPYPYKNWVNDVKELVENISDEEKQHWIDVNNLLDDSAIKGTTNVFAFNVDVNYDVDNKLMLSEEEYWALAIARAYKKTYGKDIIFNRESYGRDDSLADVSRTVGWFTSQYPVPVEVNNGKDNVSLMNDVYSLKKSFKEVKNLGLNYSSLVYTTKELEFKHCPVTFNFLSTEFVFRNSLFDSINKYLFKKGEIDSDIFDSECYGISFNIVCDDDSYIVNGSYAVGTYIGNEFKTFVENIKSELEFIGNYGFENEGVVCCLSESQLGVYLDEKVHDKGNAYASTDILECGDHSIDEINNAIHSLIDKHPILKGRILDTGDMPLLICDTCPQIDVIDDFDYSSLVKPFDLDKSLASFFIVSNDEDRFVFYNLHHIITDATGGSIIKKDFNLALNDKLDDVVDFGFIYASNDSYNSKFKQEYESAHEFFKDAFADIDDVQYLLSDVDGSVGKVSLPVRGIRDRVEEFAHENGITVSNLLNAVFAYAYSRFTGSDKVYFTFNEHGRHEQYSQDALAMFVRTIPMIVDCKNNSVNDYVSYVSDLILESMINSIYPFRLLASEFDLTNDVTFEYNYDLRDVSDVGDDIIFSDEAGEVSAFACVINDLDDGYLVSVHHFDRFSQDTAERFVNVFKEVLIQFLDKENLEDIDYISNDDVKLLDKINQTESSLMYPDVLDAFNSNLSKCPENSLVSYDDRTYTYGEGAFIANRIAEKLRELGVGPQECVAFLTERSEYYMFSILGIMSIGAVYVPLDDAYPDERIQLMMEDTGSRVVIVSDETYNRAKDLNNDSIILNISDIIKEEITSLDCLPAVHGDLACILYTSGTTGIPKGVKITRKAIASYSDSYVRKSGMDSNDVLALFASIGFDVGAVKSICVPIYAGACLNVVPSDIRLNLMDLNRHFINNNVTHANLSTQVAKLFIKEIDSTPLDILVAGGEKLGEIVPPSDCRFIDAYGPTECCVSVSAIEEVEKIDSSSIGHLLNNLKAYILDDESRRVPVGAVGELYLAGYQIAEGYLNRDEETANAFLDNPFADDEDYGVMYRTGDMVRLLPDGSLAIVGRRDSQVKIRGNRVELSEVESVIREISFVDDVTVQTIKNNGNNEIVAYVVTSQEIENLKDAVCGHVGEFKPSYMVPSFVIELDEIPLTVNGKVDKRALPEVDLDSLSAEYVAPANETEKQIVEAFEKVFNTEKISVHDDFIRLGGDSLTAIRLLSYLSDYNVTAADILSLHTPKAIAENVNEFSFDLDIYSLESGCPLNESQLNVYLDIKANDKSNSYRIPLSMRISKEFNADDINGALNSVFKSHPILGMCVSDDFEIPYLIKGSAPSVTFESGIDEGLIRGFLTEEFNLEDSLCRFLIIENDDDYVLFAVFHHLIFDDISVGVFKRDLLAALNGESIDVDSSFLKSSAFCQQIQNTEEFDDSSRFFESMLAESDDCGVLLEEVTSNQSGVLRTDLELDLNSFKSFLQENSVSENVVFTSAFAYVLSRFTGGDKVKFSMVENGRDRFDNLDSIGMYVNTLPILFNCENQSVSDFMEYSSGLIYDVMRYNFYPFRLLASKYDVDSDILFQFIPDWFDSDKTEIHNLLRYLDDMGNEDSITDLNVNIFQTENAYQLSVLYSEKYSKEMIERFAESYKLILSQIINVDELSDIEYVSKSDLELLDKINQTEHPLDYEDILDAFNDNLARYPDNNLVACGDRAYTFAEGAFIANRIAEKLRDLGVGPQDCVSFLTKRSEAYMLSVLGIMSAGAVYVPLDDAHPDERLEFILEDTQSEVVIVSDETFERVGMLKEPTTLLNISDILKEEIGTLSELPVSYGDLACILYTSGTTGIPKGVKITRKSVLNIPACYCDSYHLSNDDVYGMFSSVGFDAASWGIVLSIYSGACLDIIPEDIRLDIDAMNEYFIKHNVTQAFITTQVGKLFAERIEDTSLYLLGVGGEKLGEFESPKNYDFVDFYGPTESFVYISSTHNKNKLDSSSIGPLNYNTKAYILDEEFRQVPVGAVGELFLAGYQIADGYLNRDEETRKAFLDNPFSDDESYGILYRTGDMVRLLPDGSLAIVGRRDSQVKIRGNRVELSEIESVIREIDYVVDVTVQTIKHDANNEIVAYVVINNDLDEDILKEGICDYVARFKPSYMVPAFVIGLDEIPLNVNGKVDKTALPEVDFDNLQVEYVPPSSDNEKIIVEAFEKVFNQDKISIYDDFIRLGGDSLTAIKLLTYLDDYDLSVGDILSLHTPYAIAKNIKDISYDLDVYSIDSGCPLNEPQLNVYLDIRANDKVDAYFIPLFMPISNDYDVNRICDALDEMLRVHPILGMCINDEFDAPYLVKGSKPEILVKSVVDEEFIREFLTKPFDFYDSLSRFMIVENDDGCRLYAVFHHIIFDALSDVVFKQDLLDLLEGKSIDVDDSFLKVSAYAQQIKESGEFADADKFYEAMLVDNDDVSVVLDSVLPDGPGSIKIDLDVDVDALKSFINDNAVSENVIFAGAFAYTLSRFAGGDKVLFNIIENGRDRFNNLNAIGMFVNTLPVVVNCENKGVPEFMDYISGLIYDVMKYNYYPFRLLANKYDVDSNIIFQFLPDWISEDDGLSFDLGFDLLNEIDDLITDLSVDVIQQGKDYSLNVIYSDKYSSDFIERFVNSYKLILHDLIRVNYLSEIDYVLNTDLKLLDSYNETEHDLDYDDVLDAFNDNLSKCPDNNLVLFNDASYTYAEGAFIADRIAEKLRDLGVGPQDNVAFLIERSEGYLFSVLAILSIGAVYVPLDDAHPDSRIQFILDDTDAKVLIVSDETFERGKNLANDTVLLNISDIISEEMCTLSHLPAEYGDLACILYTSGTTGIPKGVKITRKSVLNLSEFYIRKYDLSNDDVYALFASIGFDVAMKAIFPSICAGAALSIVPNDIKLNMIAMNDYFIKHGVTHTEISTQVAKLFINQINDTTLKVLTTGGEKLGDDVIDVDYRFVDSYGPTEACVDVTSIDLEDKIDYSSIGFLLDNTKAYVLDEEFRRVPIGAVGELFLAGKQVADGYLNRDDETRKAFLENPFDAGEEYSVMYRSGDMVRVLPDGTLGIVNRRDKQVKIRGNRVELSEVESVIRNIDEIEDVTVQTIKNGANNELVAYVVAANDLEGITLKNHVCDYVAEHKPQYMVPSFVVELDAIPLTVNGKVDTRALPEVDVNKLREEYVAPENDTESFFAECFEEILGIDKVGATDNFFALGGDSLQVIKIIVESINNGYSISYADVFDNPTPRLLSNVVSSEKHEVSLIKDNYDYALIDDLLKRNNLDSFANGECVESLGNVLLTGATGFLGIHLLYELLENEDGDVYCLIRPKDNQTGKDRLKSAWDYYFKRDFSEFENRLHVVEGSITDYDDFVKLESCEIDTVINSAGNVKHFAKGTELKDINFGGTVNALEFAKTKDARFIQVSTDSVSGARVNNVPPKEIKLYETDLFIDQTIDNKYVESKFLAERAVLQAAADNELDVKIMRVGNLMARSYDGLFQRNYESNAFVNQLKSFVALGKMPSSFVEYDVQLCAIDITAKSIIALSKTPKDCCVFHPFSNNNSTYREVVNVFNKLGLNIELSDEESFQNSLDNVLDDKSKQKGVFGLLTHLNNSDIKYEYISVDNDYTIKVLSELGVTWPEITEKYLSDFIKLLDNLDFFKVI